MTEQAPRGITVLYDETCGLCRRARDWLLEQPALVRVQIVPAGHPEVQRRYAEAIPSIGRELVVVDDQGRTWTGPEAFLVCMWATARYRAWSYRLSSRLLAPFSMRFFRHVSRRRHRLGRWFGRGDTECEWCGDDDEAWIGEW